MIGFFFLGCMSNSDTSSKGFSKSGKAGSLRVTYTSDKPLTTGNNEIQVEITKEKKPVTGAKVTLKIFMPEMPGMPRMEEKTLMLPDGNNYHGKINFSMGGTWQVRIYIQKDGKKYRYKSSVIL
jgi:hypothetical protein